MNKAICIKKYIGECPIKGCLHGVLHEAECEYGITCITREGHCPDIAKVRNNTLKGDNTHCIMMNERIPTGHFKRMGIEIVDQDYL